MNTWASAGFITRWSYTRVGSHSFKKELADVVYIHRGILLSHKKKNEILPFATTWMDLEGIMLSEINQRNTNAV